MTSTLGAMVVFVIVVGLVLAVGITVGMIVAGRIDRIMAPSKPAGDGSAESAADPQPDAARIEERDE